MTAAPGRVITRETWGARPFPRPQVIVDNADLVGTEGHHSVTPARWTAEHHAGAIEADHLGRGWNGPYYSWGIHESGDVIELRGWRRSQGDAQWQAPDAYFAPIVFLMDERSDPLTDGHRAGWRFLRTVVLLSQGNATRIGWHNGRPNKADARTYCPGPNIIEFLKTDEAARLWSPTESEPTMARKHWSDALIADMPDMSTPAWDGTRPEDPATRAEAFAMAHRYGIHALSQIPTAEAIEKLVADRVDRALAGAVTPATIRRAMNGATVKVSTSGKIET